MMPTDSNTQNYGKCNDNQNIKKKKNAQYYIIIIIIITIRIIDHYNYIE